MGNLVSRVIKYMFPQNENEIVYSRELQIVLPVTQNDIFEEYIHKHEDKKKDNIWII